MQVCIVLFLPDQVIRFCNTPSPPSHCVVTNARLGNQKGHRPYTGDHCGSRTASPSEQHRDNQKRDLPPHPILKSQRPKPRTPRKTPRRADHKRHSEIRSRLQLYKQLRKSLWTDHSLFTLLCRAALLLPSVFSNKQIFFFSFLILSYLYSIKLSYIFCSLSP